MSHHHDFKHHIKHQIKHFRHFLKHNVLIITIIMFVAVITILVARFARTYNHQEPMQTNMSHMDMDHGDVTSEEQFIRDMIPHHQEAVDTSTIILAKTANPNIKQLAQNIIDAQTKEIAMLQGRLEQRYPNSVMQAHYMNMMPALTGTGSWDLDQAYLDGMIQHHQGAVKMAQGVIKIQPRPEVADFASGVINIQSDEISIMKNLMMSQVSYY